MAKAGAFAKLPATTLDQVDPRFRAADGRWVGVSGRARVIAYDPGQVPEAEVPGSVLDLTDPRWKGQVGFAPTNASFQAFVTAMRQLEGEDATRQWLEDMKANGMKAYSDNIRVLEAVDRGEVQLGLINHYYWYEKVAEEGEDQVNARIAFIGGGDPGALVNVAGAGILATTNQDEQAQDFVDFLLSREAQQYFADTTEEYPLVDGVEPDSGVPPLATLGAPEIDLSDLDSLQQTLSLLEEVGLV
jgi:iron(III) transport system substrate-binding protein